METLEPGAAALHREIVRWRPEWAAYAQIEGASLRFVVPSQNPAVPEPLTVDPWGECSLSWYGGYFWDFLGWRFDFVEGARTIRLFLEDLLEERVAVVLAFRDESPLGGGPISVGDSEAWMREPGTRVEIRSWLGTHDATWENEET